MRVLLAILFGGLALIGTAEARLGESREQVIERYGKPLQERVEGDWASMLCSKDGNKYRFYILNNKVELITISKEDLTEEQVKMFLRENSVGKGFEETDGGLLVQTNYAEADTGRTARWWHIQNMLHIETKVAIQNLGEKIFSKSAMLK